MPPIKVISIINMKGGVGKTTLTANLAYALAQFHNKKVLLIDIDPQFNATQYFVTQKRYVEYIKNPNKKTIYDIFYDKSETAPSLVKSKVHKNRSTPVSLDNVTIDVYRDGGKLDLIPSTLSLMEVQSSERGTENKLKRFIDKIKDAYDLILIDCPPTMSIYTLSAYIASDGYVIPIKPDHLSSIGFPLLERAIQDYKETFGKEIKRIGIVFTMVDKRTKLMKDTMTTIRGKHEEEVFESYLRHSTKVARAVKMNQALFNCPDALEYGEEIKNIATELLDRLEEVKK